MTQYEFQVWFHTFIEAYKVLASKSSDTQLVFDESKIVADKVCEFYTKNVDQAVIPKAEDLFNNKQLRDLMSSFTK
ncbi:MAG: hypothetical protein WC942_06545 [Clostridia bacterium]|jgi:hypothetical protein